MARKVRTDPAQISGLRTKKTSGHRRGFFLDFYLYRTSQDFWPFCADSEQWLHDTSCITGIRPPDRQCRVGTRHCQSACSLDADA